MRRYEECPPADKEVKDASCPGCGSAFCREVRAWVCVVCGYRVGVERGAEEAPRSPVIVQALVNPH